MTMILKLDENEMEFNSLTELAKYFGVSKQHISHCRQYNADKANHFLYNGHGVTVVQESGKTIELYKKNRHEAALKKIVAMEERLCIDPLEEIIEDILVVAKRGLNQPVI